jgi:DNA-binding NtrC family response regulator
MLSGVRVLVAEDESLIAMDLADKFEDAGATVLGPVATVVEALRLLGAETIDAALLDFNLADGEVSPVLKLLSARGVPIVVYTGRGLPPELLAAHPNIPVLHKPLPADRALAALVGARKAASARASGPAGTQCDERQSQEPISRAPPPLPREIQVHLGQQLRAAYHMAAEKPAFLGDAPIPVLFDQHLARMEQVERVRTRVLGAVEAACRPGRE